MRAFLLCAQWCSPRNDSRGSHSVNAPSKLELGCCWLGHRAISLHEINTDSPPLRSVLQLEGCGQDPTLLTPLYRDVPRPMPGMRVPGAMGLGIAGAPGACPGAAGMGTPNCSSWCGAADAAPCSAASASAAASAAPACNSLVISPWRGSC